MDQATVTLIESMKQKIQEQDAFLQRLSAPPLAHAIVIDIDQSTQTCTIASGNSGIFQVHLPQGLAHIGTSVLINTDTMQIIRQTKEAAIGSIGTVKTALTKAISEVAIDGQHRVVANGNTVPKAGDQVVMSVGNMVIHSILPEAKAEEFVAQTMGTVLWDDIGGQSEAKTALREAIELPLLHPEIFAAYGKTFPGGILLYGPPGNGKTLLGKASATALRKRGGDAGFFSIKGPEVLDPYVGESERKIRDLFKAARAHKLRSGNPAVIFIDEAEALLSSRKNTHSISGMERTIVPTFLAEMDGLETSSAIVILATNDPESLDPAITRDGRMDRKILVARPTATDAKEITRIHLQQAPLAKGVTPETLAETAVEAIYDGNCQVNGKKLSSFVSGAMLAAIAEQAKAYAMTRDITARSRPITGIGKDDVLAAIARIQAENGRISHALN